REAPVVQHFALYPDGLNGGEQILHDSFSNNELLESKERLLRFVLERPYLNWRVVTRSRLICSFRLQGRTHMSVKQGSSCRDRNLEILQTCFMKQLSHCVMEPGATKSIHGYRYISGYTLNDKVRRTIHFLFAL